MLRVAPIVCQPGNRLQPSTDKERNPIRTPSGHESGSSLPFTPLISPPHPAHSSPAPRPPRKKGTPSQLRKIQPNCVTSACKMISQHVGFALSGPDVWSFVMQIFLPTDSVLFALSGAPQQEPHAVYIFPRCQVRDQKLPTPSVTDRETNTSHLAACLVSHGKGRDLPLSWRLCWQGQQSSKHEPLTRQGSRKALGQGL